jgi:hypothetical protein
MKLPKTIKDQSIKFYLNTKNHQLRLISTPILLNMNQKVQTMPLKKNQQKNFMKTLL